MKEIRFDSWECNIVETLLTVDVVMTVAKSSTGLIYISS